MLTDPLILHASAVSFGGRAVVIIGPSGSGKSALAIELLALGAALVADDRVILVSEDGALRAEKPATLPNCIEARFFGLLKAPTANGPQNVALIVDLNESEDQRLPVQRFRTFLGHKVPVSHTCERGYFPAAIKLYLEHGRFSIDDAP